MILDVTFKITEVVDLYSWLAFITSLELLHLLMYMIILEEHALVKMASSMCFVV
jgi:hypothetical protein